MIPTEKNNGKQRRQCLYKQGRQAEEHAAATRHHAEELQCDQHSLAREAAHADDGKLDAERA